MILFAGPNYSSIYGFLKTQRNDVVQMDGPIGEELAQEAEMLISHRYRFILDNKILRHFEPKKKLNCHGSFLPFNRGANPQFWSALLDTPKGVTIHSMTMELDKGPIAFRRFVCEERGEGFFIQYMTFGSFYQMLDDMMLDLFKENWVSIKNGDFELRAQDERGSYHAAIEYTNLANIYPGDLNNTTIKQGRAYYDHAVRSKWVNGSQISSNP